jgi:hypothetical protein
MIDKRAKMMDKRANLLRKKGYGREASIINNEEIARELVALAKEVQGIRTAALKLKPQSSRGSEKMWVAFDGENAHGFITKMPDSKSTKHPYKVFTYPKPLGPSETAYDRTMIGVVWTKGKKGLDEAFDYLKKGKKFKTKNPYVASERRIVAEGISRQAATSASVSDLASAASSLKKADDRLEAALKKANFNLKNIGAMDAETAEDIIGLIGDAKQGLRMLLLTAKRVDRNYQTILNAVEAGRKEYEESPVTEDDIKSFEVEFAEGNIEESKQIEGKKGKTIKDMEKLVNSYSMPDIGYNKIYFDVTFNDGDTIQFRYDHGSRDPSLRRQIDQWLGSLSR